MRLLSAIVSKLLTFDYSEEEGELLLEVGEAEDGGRAIDSEQTN